MRASARGCTRRARFSPCRELRVPVCSETWPHECGVHGQDERVAAAAERDALGGPEQPRRLQRQRQGLAARLPTSRTPCRITPCCTARHRCSIACPSTTSLTRSFPHSLAPTVAAPSPSWPCASCLTTVLAACTGACMHEPPAPPAQSVGDPHEDRAHCEAVAVVAHAVCSPQLCVTWEALRPLCAV
eukprot:6207327-Pleurochrysis_carterae.AAC.1